MPSKKIYRCPIEVRGYELDSFGHVNHAVYPSYLEHARWKMLEEEGVTLAGFNQWKRWPVIAELQLQFVKPTYMGDKLVVQTQGVEVGRTNFVFEQTIFRGDEIVLKGRVRVVTVNETGRPAEMPEGMKKVWE